MNDVSDNKVSGLVDHLFRHQAGQMIATLVRVFGPRHIDLAEEVVQEALVKALQLWSYRGIPDNPSAWLIQVAKNRALDRLRREASLQEKAEEIISAFAAQEAFANQKTASDEAFDDSLAMIFMACHPSIARESRVALTLKTVGGFGTGEIARAFLAKEPTIAQRLVRAKRLIHEDGITFELPAAKEMPGRLDSVLEVIYLMFNEGYAAHSGESLVRADLCEEAIRLCTLLVQHPATNLPKSHALLALMLFQAARLATRVGAGGELALLSEQDRSRWDRRLMAMGFHHLERSAAGQEFTEYHLQAAIASCHAAATRYELTNWEQIVRLYDLLAALNPSPVVALNRAVAVAKHRGAEAGMREVERVLEHPALRQYYLLPATLGELWQELGERHKAAEHFRQALNCSCSEPERRFLQKKLAAITNP
ncbi:MAG TPA: sigma-70 family RNA polymerase sigma factor [Blastocatellia bacterium]|nr:sigma-70 family RNA polymerase sigma factor [Blastocatellia bacterium]HMX24636.1 sigma-70 family RNA polymerase sigma factor [Blastocatellia bacterium]HMY71965.1 sigma-70 family RNA polymerase sigma factor [Blastocatellia bacterium]HMZ17606.1 sigma-70 family RNA polymerase sigma factor [Blastocatellia bacterium]HNG29795.1 sigma-70 family RNA polymerase sigma factor [Blastocatellia bacterium]